MKGRFSPTARALAFGLASATALLGGWVLADPILHEYFDFDASVSEASDRGAVTAGGAAERGGPGNDVPRPPTAVDAQRGASDAEDRYQLDGDTTRPDQVGYEDPFTPSIPPFKRVFAYDSIDARFELVVNNPALGDLRVASVPLSEAFDQFFGDVEIGLRANTPERVPSVGPGAFVLAARLEPPAPFQLRKDGAENWFLTSPHAGSARLLLHLAIDRAVFGSPYGDPEWRDIAPYLPKLPDAVRRRGLEVADQLGVDRSVRPAQAVAELVAHFRSFAPSEELPEAQDPGALYREIALSKKGVCRHRAYAFTVTALALGVPTRFVRNEAHAWVEVLDGKLWHRIDLGGAAGEMQLATLVDVAHSPPADPFQWPLGSESADDMTEQALAGQASGGGADESANVRREATETATSAPEAPSNAHSAAPPAASERAEVPPSSSAEPDGTSGEFDDPSQATTEEPTAALDVELEPHDEHVSQGGRVHLSGSVRGPLGVCALQRVDVVLVTRDRTVPIGSLVTDAAGVYGGAITLPNSVPVGDYELRVVPHAAGECRTATP
jgi:hypothetical protein